MADYNTAVLQRFGLDPMVADTITPEVTLFTIPGGNSAAQTWGKLATNWKELGGWPILCGPEKERPHLVRTLSNSPVTTSEILAAVPTGSPTAIFEQRLREANAEWPDDEELKSHQSRVLAEPDFSSWPTILPEQKRRRLHGTFDHRNQQFEKCLLAIIKPAHRAHAPAYLRFGHYNDCPPPALHVAQLKNWFERFGAVPVVITHDVIEVCVSVPLTDPRQAFEVAREQYLYSPDIVDQGTETVANLAKEIWNQRFWYFWWD
jgi:hypothetical protein